MRIAAGEAAVRPARRQSSPNVVVMDISLADVSGIEVMRRLLVRDPRARVLMFGIHDEPIFPDRAFKAGACPMSDREYFPASVGSRDYPRYRF